jgi:hypothetical protein
MLLEAVLKTIDVREREKDMSDPGNTLDVKIKISKLFRCQV